VTVIELDLTEVGFVDSTGIGVMAGALRRLEPVGGRLELRHGDSEVVASVHGEIDADNCREFGALLLEDTAGPHRLWSPEGDRFFPGGVDDPNLRVLVVDPTTAEYWDAPASRIERLAMKASSLLGRHADPGRSGSIDLH
jgi:hypothetical protein